MPQIKLPASKFLVVETEQIQKFVNELNKIKEDWEIRLINLEDKIRKLEAARKAKAKRA